MFYGVRVVERREAFEVGIKNQRISEARHWNLLLVGPRTLPLRKLQFLSESHGCRASRNVFPGVNRLGQGVDMDVVEGQIRDILRKELAGRMPVYIA